MAYYKIFSKKLTKANVGALDSENLEYTKYLIAFAASENDKFEAVTIQRRLDDSEPFTIITSNKRSEKGQVTEELGYFSPGDQVDIFWIITAVSKIAAIAAYVINDKTREIRKLSPVTGARKLDKGEDWGERASNFKLF